nr:MAG TPA: hypothetical protein [Caudoviricetes sp.]
MEEVKSNAGWSLFNTVLGGGALASALGIGIPALVKSNNAEDDKCSGVKYATATDLAYAQELAKKDSEIALLKSEQNTEVKIADVYDRLVTKINDNYKEQSNWNAQQMVNNCQMSSAIAVNTNNITALQSSVSAITKVIVPKSAICPEVMERYNSWTAPTNTPATGA